MASPTRFVNGVSTQGIGKPLGQYPVPDPTDVYTDFHDFGHYVAADWTVTNTTSHSTVGLVAGANGVLGLVAGGSAVTADIANVQANPLDFNFTTSTPVWFYAAFKVTTALNDQVLLGITSDASALAPTDGIYFNKAAGSASIDFVVRKSSTSTTTSAVATLADNTYIELGFYYNGKDAVDVFVNEVKVASVTTLTNLPAAVALGTTAGQKLAATSPTTAALYVDFLLSASGRTY